MLLCKYSTIKKFTGQGVEKVNDGIKLIYHRKTNRHDTTLEAFRVRQRKYLNRTCVRIKRKYRKINPNFWVIGKRRAYSVKLL
jgi:hypothetical protein